MYKKIAAHDLKSFLLMTANSSRNLKKLATNKECVEYMEGYMRAVRVIWDQIEMLSNLPDIELLSEELLTSTREAYGKIQKAIDSA